MSKTLRKILVATVPLVTAAVVAAWANGFFRDGNGVPPPSAANEPVVEDANLAATQPPMATQPVEDVGEPSPPPPHVEEIEVLLIVESPSETPLVLRVRAKITSWKWL